MPMLRTLRLLNQLESNTITSTQLETLFTDAGRLADFVSLFQYTSTCNRLITNPSVCNIFRDSNKVMTALAGSSIAMRALAGSSIAMTALAGSSIAMTALIGSSSAMTALAGSSIAMTALAGSSSAMISLARSSSAMTALAGNIIAGNAIRNSAVTSKRALLSTIPIGTYCPYFYGYYIGSLDLQNGTRSYYFLAPTSTQANLPYGYGGTNLNITDIPSYTNSASLDPLTNNGNLSWDGNIITKNYLAGTAGTAGYYVNSLITNVGGFTTTAGTYFLPSLHELVIILHHKDIFNAKVPSNETLTKGKYWSSTEYNIDHAWLVNFSNGAVAGNYKGDNNFVRGVSKIVV